MGRQRRISPQTRAVLVALAGAAADPGSDGWRHGYDLCAQLGLKAGTLYPILIRLAERGELERRWEEDPPRGRPARHLYRLSPSGVALADAARLASSVAESANGRARGIRSAPGVAT